ncbi:hypothetical protein [Butyrivibrio sp. AE2032]|uniref:hypothetical protein n=1 Tax=Butyrivibrio sp. AE2032 TaxID=1458463 RepID=UPI00054F77BB|nr:hypothetical protein [Butyrivibrio sp. AE2032]
MSKILDKMWSKLLAVIVIVLFVIGFKELIVTDSKFSDAFGELMQTLPFSKLITSIICKVMKYQKAVPFKTSTDVIFDFVKLAVMATVQPAVVRLFSIIFLRVPGGDYHEREDLMNGVGYRIKEMIITIFTAPFVAFIFSYIISQVSSNLADKLGQILSSVIGIVALIVICILSALILAIVGRISFGKALLWRISITLVGKMLQSTGTNAICLWIYLAIIEGISGQVISAIVAIVIWLIITETALRIIRHSIA